MTLIDESAVPSLGIALLDGREVHDQEPRQVSSGCRAIDSVLDGGLNYSEITTIAAITQQSRSLLTLNFIASHLILQTSSNVIVVDSTGSFAVEHLRDIVADKLVKDPGRREMPHAGYMYQPVVVEKTDGKAQAMSKAADVLDNVRIARIFDVTGLVETLGEVRQTCEAARPLDTPAIPGDEDASGPGAVGMVVVDDLASLMSPLIANNHTGAQALLSSICRSMSHLAKSHGICVLLLNGIVGSVKSQPSGSTIHTQIADGVSIFKSTPGKPALGQTFASLVDVSIMLCRMPRSRKDAEIVYGGGSATQSADAAYTEVLEVLKDRSGRRQNRVAAFEVLDGWRIIEYTG